jgi:2-keto-4-pentenoate hydratase/2-oxohepta-3-ene-1,7-dioic acid hydratase in catechol pathway
VKFATLLPWGTGIVLENGIVPVESRTMMEIITRFDELEGQLQDRAQTRQPVPFEKARLGAPIPAPSKIWAAAANYRRGTSDLGQASGRGAAGTLDPNVLLENTFLKPPSAITGPNSKIVIPRIADTVFPELELCVVIGQKSRDLSEADVWQAIFGYTIMLDVTARGGHGSGQGNRNTRKGYDTFAPIGPWITTRDEIANPEALEMKLWVNGQLRQSAKTDAMINGVARLTSYLSTVGTLMPGDLITTGNPDAPDFQEKLVPGDEVKAEIQGIGAMTLTVAKEE